MTENRVRKERAFHVELNLAIRTDASRRTCAYSDCCYFTTERHPSMRRTTSRSEHAVSTGTVCPSGRTRHSRASLSGFRDWHGSRRIGSGVDQAWEPDGKSTGGVSDHPSAAGGPAGRFGEGVVGSGPRSGLDARRRVPPATVLLTSAATAGARGTGSGSAWQLGASQARSHTRGQELRILNILNWPESRFSEAGLRITYRPTKVLPASVQTVPKRFDSRPRAHSGRTGPCTQPS